MIVDMARKQDDPEQSKRFIAFAREHGADDEGELFERGFKTIAPLKRPAEKPKAKARKRNRSR